MTTYIYCYFPINANIIVTRIELRILFMSVIWISVCFLLGQERRKVVNHSPRFIILALLPPISLKAYEANGLTEMIAD